MLCMFILGIVKLSEFILKNYCYKVMVLNFILGKEVLFF